MALGADVRLAGSRALARAPARLWELTILVCRERESAGGANMGAVAHPSILGIIGTGSPEDSNGWVVHTPALRVQFSLRHVRWTDLFVSIFKLRWWLMLVLVFLGSLFNSIRFRRWTSRTEPCVAAKVIACVVVVVSRAVIVVRSRIPINLSSRV